MKSSKIPLRALTALLLLSSAWVAAPAQSTPEPRREQLLNGLRILLWSRPADQNVLIKLRVHSGAAFDLAGKEGLMATLVDAMFDQQTRDYVTEELGGRIEVALGYDTLDITLAGRSTDLERLLELARIAVINPQLTPARVERPDLLLIRERFLNPDNTTLVVVGGFEPKRLMRTMREQFGGWRKSDR